MKRAPIDETPTKLTVLKSDGSDVSWGSVVSADIAANTITTDDLSLDLSLGYRNVIINSAMQVAQRGTSTASITAYGYYTADRFIVNISAMGTWT